jgi:hypothetical protein
MGWSDGSSLLEEIIEILVDELEDDQKERIYLKLIKLFEHNDCDTLMDIQSSDPIFDDVLNEYYENGDGGDMDGEENEL